MIGFLGDESGAISVDWVVLTGAVVGLGLATSAVISASVGDLSNEVADGIARAGNKVAAFSDFEDGLGGWIGGSVSVTDTYGAILRGDRNTPTNATFELDPNKDYAVVTFDMHTLDSWDNEDFRVFIDGELVATTRFNWRQDGAVDQWQSDNPDIAFSVQQTQNLAQREYRGRWPEQSHQMRVVVRNPGASMNVGFDTTLNQHRNDESWGVDNVSVISTDNP